MEKMKTKLFGALVVLLRVMSGVSFTGCSDDDDKPVDDSNEAVAFNFSLRFEDAEEAEDQPDLITTTYSFVNHRGEVEEGVFSDEFVDEQTIKSQNYTTLPGEVEIVITETLNPEVELTKTAYSVGLKLALQATSYAKDDVVIDAKSKTVSGHLTVPVANLGKIYPKTTRLKFAVAKDGTVTM